MTLCGFWNLRLMIGTCQGSVLSDDHCGLLIYSCICETFGGRLTEYIF